MTSVVHQDHSTGHLFIWPEFMLPEWKQQRFFLITAKKGLGMRLLDVGIRQDSKTGPRGFYPLLYPRGLFLTAGVR